MNRRVSRAFLPVLATFLWMLGGCGLGGGTAERQTPTSGDPEADRRADMRVGADTGTTAKKTGTLYERLGGEQTIRAIVDDMAVRAIADPRVNFSRRNVKTSWTGRAYKPWDEKSPESVDRFKQHMVEFLTLASGGAATYTGGDIKAVHQGMKITNNEFDAMVGDIRTSMAALGIGRQETRELLAIIETTRKQIVEKP